MKRALLAALGLVAVALAARSLALGAGMGAEDARHLLVRTGFGATPEEIASFAKLNRTEAIDRILRGYRPSASTPAPAFASEPITPPRVFRNATTEERRELIRRETERAVELRAWWVGEMLATPSPLTERMTLFWHNHFVSSQQKVRISRMLYDQNLLLRRHALGNFGDLLHGIARDPAMVIYLDSATNRKDRPNENFAREVMELFTLGVGQYTEQDVREAARAFTGWSIDPDTGRFLFRRLAHDDGTKTIFGRTGAFDGDEVLDLLLAHRATAEFIVAKLWREFVGPEAPPAEIERVARTFRGSNYEIRSALREILKSAAFWADESRGALVKSPVDLVVGTVRQFGFEVGDPLPLAIVAGLLGQNLFAPPNVKGWPGGEAWINSATLLGRKQFLERVFRDEGMRPNEMPRVAGRPGRIGAEGRERFVRGIESMRFDALRFIDSVHAQPGLLVESVVLAVAPVDATAADASAAERVRRLVLDPAYQVK